MKKVILALILSGFCVSAFAIVYDPACLDRLSALGLIGSSAMKSCEVK